MISMSYLKFCMNDTHQNQIIFCEPRHGLFEFDNEDEFLFHAGTKIMDNKFFSNGGRVLNFVKTSKSYKKSRDDIIKLIKNLNWENGFFRKDIGHRVIDS